MENKKLNDKQRKFIHELWKKSLVNPGPIVVAKTDVNKVICVTEKGTYAISIAP